MLAQLRLRAQFDKAMQLATANQLRHDSEQLALLNSLISDYRHKEQLIAVVLARMSDGQYTMGDDARSFFLSCADAVFHENLTKKTASGGSAGMKELHPLWGESWFSK